MPGEQCDITNCERAWTHKAQKRLEYKMVCKNHAYQLQEQNWLIKYMHELW